MKILRIPALAAVLFACLLTSCMQEADPPDTTLSWSSGTLGASFECLEGSMPTDADLAVLFDGDDETSFGGDWSSLKAISSSYEWIVSFPEQAVTSVYFSFLLESDGFPGLRNRMTFGYGIRNADGTWSDLPSGYLQVRSGGSVRIAETCAVGSAITAVRLRTTVEADANALISPDDGYTKTVTNRLAEITIH